MGVLFISHSSKNNDAAVKVRDWLNAQGWREVFLDLDPAAGLAPGQRWQDELKKVGERCLAVIVLISKDWVASRWCQIEYLLADQLGKRIFPVLITPTPFDDLPLELKAKFQLADISTPEKEVEGLARLAVGLKRAGLDPKSFNWPPPNEPGRPIYRGLQSLEEQDAAIFFGRDAAITKGLDALRRMRAGARERMLVILGASGAGKSSFLKAGLIARLKRDEENFLVLPIIRPERAALTGSQGVLASIGRHVQTARDAQVAFSTRRGPIVERFTGMAAAGGETYAAKPPTIVIPIDQCEEFFAADNTEAGRALDLLSETIQADGDAIVIATIRSDNFERLQTEKRLAALSRLPFDLAPILPSAFKDVIEGPARLAQPPLAVDPALTDQLLKDLDAADALPLLAFTLQRLVASYGTVGKISLADYVEGMRGLQGAITGAVEVAFSAAAADPSLPKERAALERLARVAFIPALVQLDDAASQPKRRVERFDALPETTRPLVRHFVDQRLLVTDQRVLQGVECEIVEVAHEAILRQWALLDTWIAEERDALRTLESVRRSAREWEAHPDSDSRVVDLDGESWLVHRGDRLVEAEKIVVRPDFGAGLTETERAYLRACRTSESARHAAARAARRRTIGLVAAFVLAVTVAGGVAIWQAELASEQRKFAVEQSQMADEQRNLALAQTQLANEQRNLAVARQLATDARIASDSSSESGLALERSLLLATASLSSAWTQEGFVAWSNAIKLSPPRPLTVLASEAGPYNHVTSNSDGSQLAVAGKDAIFLLDGASLSLVATLPQPGATALAFSRPDGQQLAVGVGSSVVIWDIPKRQIVKTLPQTPGWPELRIESLAFDSRGKRLAFAGVNKFARVFETEGWTEVARSWSEATLVANETIFSVAFSPDDASLLTAGLKLISWNLAALTNPISQGREIDSFLPVVIVPQLSSTSRFLSFSRDGSQLAVHNGLLTVGRLGGFSLIPPPVAVAGGEIVALNADATLVATSSDGGGFAIWQTSPPNTRNQLARMVHEIVDPAPSPVALGATAEWLVSGGKQLDRWRLDAGPEALRLPHKAGVLAVASSPNGRFVATATSDGFAHIWSTSDWKELRSLEIKKPNGDERLSPHIAFSSDGRWLATTSGNVLKAFSADDWREVARTEHAQEVKSVAFSTDVRWILAVQNDEDKDTVDLIATDTWRVAHMLPHDRFIDAISVSPDGRQLLTQTNPHCERAVLIPGVARVWSTATGERLASLQLGHEWMPELTRSCPRLPQNVQEASSGSVELISAVNWIGIPFASVSELKTADGHASARRSRNSIELAIEGGVSITFDRIGVISDMALAQNGRWLVTASYDGNARVWALNREDMIAQSCSRLRRNFSEKERGDYFGKDPYVKICPDLPAP